jgi:hypothetical protein
MDAALSTNFLHIELTQPSYKIDTVYRGSDWRETPMFPHHVFSENDVNKIDVAFLVTQG